MSNSIIAARNRVFHSAVQILAGESEVLLQPEEKLIFGLKRFSYSRDYLLRKEIFYNAYDTDTHGYLLTLTTEEMDLEPGMYCYDIALERADGELEKIIGCTDFEVVRSVVRSELT